MLKRACLSVALLLAMPAWPQMGDQMPLPSGVSGLSYPTSVGSETRSNFLRAGLAVTGAYSDNVFPSTGASPISELNFTIYPTVAIDQTLPRLHWNVTYNPGFTFYQRTSSDDQTNENVEFNFMYRLSPHLTLNLQDSLQKTSSVLNQPNPLSQGAVSGSAPTTTVGVIAPVADQLTNTANMVLSYQLGPRELIGARGAFTNLDFLDPVQVTGLYDSTSSGGSAFYIYQLSETQEVGATYQYANVQTYPAHQQSQLVTQSILGSYTLHLKPALSFSFLGGEQHYSLSQLPLPAYSAWSPSFTGSLAWQGHHTNFAVNYSRVVAGGGGLVGAFKSNSATAFTRWQMARTWGVGASGSYATNEDETPSAFLSTQGGHSIFGTVTLQHQLSQRLQMSFGYSRLHQSYSGIPVIFNAPNTNYEFISISYQLSRPLGG